MANFKVGSPGNVAYLGRLGFSVGNPEFLDSAASKILAYWRGLEYGSELFVGREIFGLWGEGTRLAPGSGGFFGAGHSGGQQFFPLGFLSTILPGEGTPTAKALRYLRKAGEATTVGGMRMANTRGTSIKAVVKNPIIAQGAYKKAWESFMPAQQEKEAVLQIFRNTGFTSGGFQGRSHGKVVGGQSCTRFADVRRRRPQAISSAGVLARTGFISGGAISGYTGSLAGFDRVFQRDLTNINRELAGRLAELVAQFQEDAIKRKSTTSGKLIAATLDPRNRFPS